MSSNSVPCVYPDYPLSDKARDCIDAEIMSAALAGLSMHVGDWHQVPNFTVAPSSVVFTKSKPDGRVCSDQSVPGCANESIPKDAYKIKLPGVVMLLRAILMLGAGCFVGVVDVANAFGQLRLSPQDCLRTGRWWPKYAVPILMSWPLFGFSSSPALFILIMNLVRWCSLAKMRRDGVQWDPGWGMWSYIDDNFFVAPSFAEATVFANALMEAFDYFGMAAKRAKTVVGQSVKILGMIVNTVSLTVSVDKDKRDEVLALMKRLRRKKYLSLHELQSLAGQVLGCTSVLPPAYGRAFLCEILYLIRKARPGVPVKLSKDMVADLISLAAIMKDFSSRSFAHDLRMDNTQPVEATMFLGSDASGHGIAGVDHVSGLFVHQELPGHQQLGNLVNAFDLSNVECKGEREKISILLLECLAMAHIVLVASKGKSTQTIVCNMDNSGLCQSWENGWSKRRAVGRIFRLLQWELMAAGNVLYLKHVPTDENILSDKLSRMRNIDYSSPVFARVAACLPGKQLHQRALSSPLRTLFNLLATDLLPRE